MRNSIGILITSLLIFGCSNGKELTAKKPGISKASIIKNWGGKNAQELVNKYGEPDMIIDTSLLGRAPSEGYIYSGDSLTGMSGCLNVYVVAVHDNIIHDYFCR